MTSNGPGTDLNPNADEFEAKSDSELETDASWEISRTHSDYAGPVNLDGKFVNKWFAPQPPWKYLLRNY